MSTALICTSVAAVLIFALTPAANTRSVGPPQKETTMDSTIPDSLKRPIDRELKENEVQIGDIVYTKEQLEMLSKDEAQTENWNIYLWPNGVVPYAFDWNVPLDMQNDITTAINDYYYYTCIQWVPRTYEYDYVIFTQSNTCRSSLGRQGGAQYIELSWNCMSWKATSIHEMFHALGRFHEQSRQDRDDYVSIQWGNVNNGYENANFWIQQGNTYGIGYDIYSIMHYGAWSHSWNGGATIIPRDPSIALNDVGGEKPGYTFTYSDVAHALAAYPCIGK